MPNNETLNSKETLTPVKQETESYANSITKHEVEAIYSGRKNQLEEIRSVICLKFYNDILEKLEAERQVFQSLLDMEFAKQEVLAHYSFVLNPYFFEQTFIES